MSVTAAMVAGGAVGVTHALEADHLAAMATLVDERRTSIVGASWGIGHTLPILAVGLSFVALGVHLPESVTQLFEVVVGVALVAYGLRLAADAAGFLGHDSHSHDGSNHGHLRIGGAGLGLGHSHGHLDRESLLVGTLHGLAGSGGLVVAMATTAPSIDAALAFLLAFGLLTTLTMTAVATVWGRTVGTVLTRVLKGVGGIAGAAIGVALVAEVTLGIPLLP
jgi:sulfite exporter TauE/SafE